MNDDRSVDIDITAVSQGDPPAHEPAPEPDSLDSGEQLPANLCGVRIGPYVVLGGLGSGGMATVLLAQDERQAGIHQYVALKCVHSHLASDPQFVAMFLDEARIASLLRHPNVCRVMDYGFAEGRRYLTMEHLCGVSLATVRRAISSWLSRAGARRPSLVERRRTDVRRAALVARMIDDACEGLHAVHELRRANGTLLNVVHRDISPENLMLTCHGVVKLVDFGIVKADFQRHTTQEGIVKGKLAYLPPEALHGRVLDRRADVWAVGVSAWELFTGQRLFRRDTEVQTLQAVAKGEVRAPSSVCRTLSPLYDAPILKALAADPDARYQDARSFGRALREVSNRLGRGVDAGDLQDWLDESFGHDAVCRERWAVETTNRNMLVQMPLEPRISAPSQPGAAASSQEGTSQPDAVTHPDPVAAPPTGDTTPIVAHPKARRLNVAALAVVAVAAAATVLFGWDFSERGIREQQRAVPASAPVFAVAVGASSQPSTEASVGPNPAPLPSGDDQLFLELWDAERKNMIWRMPLRPRETKGASNRRPNVWPSRHLMRPATLPEDLDF